MGIAPERTFVPSVAPLRIQSRALKALPVTAFLVDLALITVTVFLATYSRSHFVLLDTSGSGPASPRVLPTASRSRSPSPSCRCRWSWPGSW